MLWRSVAVASAAALAAVVWTGSARAGGDTMRLGLDVAAPTITLGGDREADTVDVQWRRFGYYGGYNSYYRPYSYGYSSYYYRPYSYGYSSFYYRPYSYGYSYYRPYSYGYSSYYPRYYGYRSYYRPYYGISLDGDCGGQVATLPGNPGTTLTPQTRPPAVKDGTFPYDGGPDRPVPMPKVEDESEGTRIPKKTTPRVEGIPVSMPAPAKTKYVYPAYGEKLGR